MSETAIEAAGEFVDIVFDGPPSHESGRFVEVENDKLQSISFGEWIERDDGYWVLRIRAALAAAQRVAGERSETAHFGAIATAISLLSSCIKSGEAWSPECERAKNEAFDALSALGPALAVSPGKGSVNRDDLLHILHSYRRKEIPLADEAADQIMALFASVSPGKVEGWREIASAPKDGTHFLACDARTPYDKHWTFNQRPPTVVHWFQDGFYTSVNETEPMHPFSATHWQSLDSPPISSRAEDS
jgi:hypothetical protein